MYRWLKITLNFILLILLAGFPDIAGQTMKKSESDSTTHPKKVFRIREDIVPATLIITGLALSGNETKKSLQDKFPRTSTKIDNWLQWSPGAVMYTADIFTKKHRNNLFNQTKYLCISLLATSAITQLIKVTTHVTRPNGGSLSFPSGHTSNSFAGATVLFQEYRDYNLLIASSGYVLSSATGILRITNNRHWVPDVLAGAGLGIIITNLVYYFEPLKNWDPFKLSKNERLTIIPAADPGMNYYGLAVRVKL
jgi:hypothetical protein